jgi:hypothetical protein
MVFVKALTTIDYDSENEINHVPGKQLVILVRIHKQTLKYAQELLDF